MNAYSSYSALTRRNNALRKIAALQDRARRQGLSRMEAAQLRNARAVVRASTDRLSAR